MLWFLHGNRTNVLWCHVKEAIICTVVNIITPPPPIKHYQLLVKCNPKIGFRQILLLIILHDNNY